jgi:hypothetical protein
MQQSQVERVVYSTCSLHAEEDEMVVAAALRSESEKEAEQGKGYRPFELRRALPVRWGCCPLDLQRSIHLYPPILSYYQNWSRRGLIETPDGRPTNLTEEQAACLVRTDPSEDRTNGFFVARFERRGGGSVLLSDGGGRGAAAVGAGKEKAVKEKGQGKGKRKKRPRDDDDEDEEEEEGGGEGKDDGQGKRVAADAAVPTSPGEQGGGATRAQRRRERRKRLKQQLQQGQQEEDGREEKEEDEEERSG